MSEFVPASEGPWPEGPRQFATTHWSVVLAAGQSTSSRSVVALNELCRAYWPPLYAYVRRKVGDPHMAQDLTQEFLARLLEKRSLKVADPARGRFRSFLLTSLQHFLSDQWDRGRAQKRGGGREVFSLDLQTAEEGYRLLPSERLDPEKIFERRWATTLLEEAMARLEKEYETAGKRKQFDILHPFLLGESSEGYAEVGRSIGMSEAAIKVAVHRMRRSYRGHLRNEIAKTVADPGEIDDELRHLMAVLSS